MEGIYICIEHTDIYQHSLFVFLFPFAFKCHLSSNARHFSTDASGLLLLGIYHQVKGKRVDFRIELELKILTKYKYVRTERQKVKSNMKMNKNMNKKNK